MDLRTFVSESLVQICEGVRDAQARTLKMGAYVCPKPSQHQTKRPDGTVDVEFDVAVVATSEKGSASGSAGGLSVAMASVFRAGMKSDSKSSEFVQDATVSRLKFVVPVRWPLVEVRKGEEIESSECQAIDGALMWHEKTKASRFPK